MKQFTKTNNSGIDCTRTCRTNLIFLYNAFLEQTHKIRDKDLKKSGAKERVEQRVEEEIQTVIGDKEQLEDNHPLAIRAVLDPHRIGQIGLLTRQVVVELEREIVLQR